MRCPRCGTTNGKTNRYCRGCGLKLEGLNAQHLQQTNTDANLRESDEIALGEELFDIWQHYSSGDLDVALDKAEKIIRRAPESTSAHNILALIYEKKAEKESAAGNEDAARGLLKLAVEQYERIIDLNPDSAADREKLVSLRLKISGQTSTAPRPRNVFDFRTAIKAVPLPFLAGFATMLVLFVIGVVLFLPGEGAEESAKAKSQPGVPTQKLKSVSTPSGSEAATDAENSVALKVYTFPPPAPRDTAGAVGAAQIPPTPASGGKVRIPTDAMKLPSIGGAHVEVVPESKKTSSSTKPESIQGKREDTGKGQIKIAQPKTNNESVSQEPTGNDMLASAIELYRQGKISEAIGAAQKAAELFQAEVDAGKNVAAAKRGVDNAQKLIQLWQQSSQSVSP